MIIIKWYIISFRIDSLSAPWNTYLSICAATHLFPIATASFEPFPPMSGFLPPPRGSFCPSSSVGGIRYLGICSKSGWPWLQRLKLGYSFPRLLYLWKSSLPPARRISYCIFMRLFSTDRIHSYILRSCYRLPEVWAQAQLFVIQWPVKLSDTPCI